MAAGDLLVVQGTTVTWRASGGTYVLTLTSLANNAGRKGGAHNFGAKFPAWVRVELFCAFDTAPTAGNFVHVYWASSADGTNYDGNLAAGDGEASDADVHQQLHYVGSLYVNNSTAVQRASWLLRVPGRYGFPVVMNNAGQALSATAANNGLNVTPLIDQYQTA